MSEIILNADGNDVVVFVKFSYGPKGELLVDASLRAKDKDTLIAACVSQGLLLIVENSETIIISPAVYDFDEETGERTLVKAEVTENKPLPDTIGKVRGASLSHIGSVVITPAVMDGEEVLKPAVMDHRHHADLRIHGPMLSTLNSEGFEKWKVTAINWTKYGKDASGNKAERGLTLSDVTLIDPATISSASLNWAGDE